MLFSPRAIFALFTLAAIALVPAAARVHQRAAASDPPHHVSLRFSHSCSSAPEKIMVTADAADPVMTPDDAVVEPRPALRLTDITHRVPPADPAVVAVPDFRPPPFVRAL